MGDSINNQNKANNSKKKVLFVITQSEFGGAQRFLSYLINNLDMARFECAIVTGSDGNGEIRNLLSGNVRLMISSNLKRNPNIFSDIASIFELKNTIKEFRPDTLFLNSSKAGFIGSLAAKLLETKNYRVHPKLYAKEDKLKIIYRIGGWSFNDPRPRWQNYLYRLLEKISAPWKDYIILNNKYDYGQAVKYGFKPRQKLVLVHNGIDPYKLDFLDKETARTKLMEQLAKKHGGLIHNGKLIGTIANFYPTKGLQYLIEAFAKLNIPNQTFSGSLIIIGGGKEKANLELQIKEAGLQSRIYLVGRIPDAHRYLPAFDIFILPSVKEGFPWALLEAMSAKLPVITTSVGANTEIIENEKNGLIVPPANPQALAKAINRLLENESLRREFGIQAHQTVLHRFSLNKMVSQIEELL